ncbi:MAG: hypothetical protein WA990_15060 [Rubrobacteraceae bacterium]
MSLRVGEILDSPVKFVTPLVYAAAILLVAVPILQVSVAIVYVSWLPGISFYLMPILLLSTVSGLAGWGLLWLEGLNRPGIFDHIRRCSVLYTGLIFLGLLLLNAVYKGTADLGPSITTIAFLVIANAVFADAIVLLLKRRRFSGAHSGSLS